MIYFLTFDSKDQHERFSKEEIEILTFFGKELMKGLRLEQMDDILHDFRNPAIAAAGFSKRVEEMLRQGLFPSEAAKIYQWLDIIHEETSRIQDLALTLDGAGKERIIDLTDRGKGRRSFVFSCPLRRKMRGTKNSEELQEVPK